MKQTNLRKDPYKPLSSISLKWLTIKTVFLVFLASGRRGSEVHAFSAMDLDIAFEPDGSISIHFLPEFLAQNQQPGITSPVAFIHPLSSILAQTLRTSTCAQSVPSSATYWSLGVDTPLGSGGFSSHLIRAIRKTLEQLH